SSTCGRRLGSKHARKTAGSRCGCGSAADATGTARRSARWRPRASASTPPPAARRATCDASSRARAERAGPSADRYNLTVDTLSRRQLLQGAAASAAVLVTPLSAWTAPERGRVVVAREADRAKAVAACLEALEFNACSGRGVAMKANFNSDDA